jgi:hypothetical protein
MIVSKNEAEKMSEDTKKNYCEWCFHKSYGDCAKCALFQKQEPKK